MPWFAVSCEVWPQPEPTVVFIPPPTPTPRAGSLYTVRSGSIVDMVRVRGRVAATKEAFLFFGREGWLKTLKVKPGDQVSQGDLVAELNDPDLNRQVADAEYFLNRSRLELTQAKEGRLEKTRLSLSRAKVSLGRIDAEMESAKVTAMRRKTLKDRAYGHYLEVAWKQNRETVGALNALEDREVEYLEAVAKQKMLEADRQVASLDIAVLEKELENATLEVAILESAAAYRLRLLEMTRERLAETRIEAPFSGVILAVETKLGDRINPFETIGSIADPSHLQVEANVPEADAGNVSVGQSAVVTLDAYPQSRLSGKVTQIAVKASMWQGKSVYKVTIEFDDADKVRAAVRMGADVGIATITKNNVILVSARAIYSDGAEKYVDVVSPGKMEKVRIETGITDGNHTEVLRGLAAGQVIRIP